MIAALQPFRSRSFRYQWPADLCAAWALEMETLVLGWYVLTESGSVLLLTVFGALQYVGTLVSPMLGAIGDRIGLRNLLAAMRLCYALCAATLLLLAATGRLDPWAVLAVSAVCGLVRPSDIGMRTALVGATVPSGDLAAAMGIARTTMDSAKIGGALAGAGVMAGFGMAPAYLMVTILHLAGVFLTLKIEGGRHPGRSATPLSSQQIDQPPAAAPPRTSPWRDLREGLVYVWRTPHLLAAMSVAALVNLTAYPITNGLLPYVAREVFRMNQQGLGWLVASYAAGALAGSLLMSTIGPSVRPARMMLGAAAFWFLSLIAFAHAPGPGAGMALLACAGGAQSLSMIAVQVMLIRTTEPRLRGRIMGVRMLAIYPLPLGLLLAGAAIPAIGYHATVTILPIAGLLLAAAIAFAWREALLPEAAAANAR
ncbi:MAG TPA: MFS transporter [Quisquiliibacterium sp.]|nr:MFS transporter [Quisquiliibacterium sp.]